MAAEFPDCKFFGVDLHALHPDQVIPPNCTFEQHNVLDGKVAATCTLALDATHSLEVATVVEECAHYVHDALLRPSKKSCIFSISYF